VTAVKHAVVDAPHAVDAPLQAALPGFLRGIEDPDRCRPCILSQVLMPLYAHHAWRPKKAH
jgi:hypothetical protein